MRPKFFSKHMKRFCKKNDGSEKKKYTMIVTAEDERYGVSVGLGFFADALWEGSLEEVVYGNSFDELYGDGHNEGLFYQLYDSVTGKRISYGIFDPDTPKEEIEEWERREYDETRVG